MHSKHDYNQLKYIYLKTCSFIALSLHLLTDVIKSPDIE